MIGERIRKLRSERGLSQEALAELVHVSRQAVSKWETGESVPDVERLMMLCRALDVSSDWLLFGEKPIREENAAATPQAKPRTNGRAYRITAIVMTALGGLGILVMWVLSTMLVSDRWEEVAATDLLTGKSYITLKHYGVYDFSSFIETYRLHALLLIFGILLAVGAGMLLVRCFIRWWHKHPSSDHDK